LTGEDVTTAHAGASADGEQQINSKGKGIRGGYPMPHRIVI
jgi:hypothetical protein